MFKLPICPHCHTVYDYKEVAKNQKEFQCYHCKKKIKVKKIKGHLCLFLLTCIVGTLIDIAILSISAFEISTFIPLFIATFICVVIAFFLTPYFTDYVIDKK